MAQSITDSSLPFDFHSLRESLKSKSFFFTIIFILSIVLILVPLPGVFLDFFMILNLILSLVILITVINTKNNLEFSVFPTILLWGTLFRLVINISSTRLILTKGVEFDGNVVRAFSDFVSGGSFLIGIIIFTIIVTVQFLVITRGANRASEVSARFRLDSLPGKQIAIDADLSAGMIDETEAIRRREEVQQEADFYGSMDGASKFINGEVIASIIIVFINIIGGVITGTLVHSESLSGAVESYLRFAIGDGLVASIPSLVIAIAAGIVVTRTISKNNIAEDLFIQLLNNASTFYLLGVFVLLLSFLPGFPMLVMFPIGLFLFYLAYLIQKKFRQEEAVIDEKEDEIETESDLTPEKIAEGIQVDAIEIEVGYELIPLADTTQGGDLMERIRKSRKQLALELGLIIPQVRISDNMQLQSNQYQIKINGSVVGEAKLILKKLLAIDSTGGKLTVKGAELVQEPVFGLNAYWVDPEEKEILEKRGFTVADSPTTLTTHLTELIKENATEVLGRKETKDILNSVGKNNATLIEEVNTIPNKLGVIQKVLGELLEEGISIRNINLILEAICDHAKSEISSDDLIELVRQRLKRQISALYSDHSKNLNLILLSDEWEASLLNAVEDTEKRKLINLDPGMMKNFLIKLKELIQNIGDKGYHPVLMTDVYLRKPLKNIIKKTFKDLRVISQEEVADGYFINVIGKI